MPEDYGKAVLNAYQKKKEDESLSSNLLNPTPGSLREECLIVYQERQLTSKDDEILRQFFGAAEQGKGYFTLINGSFASKFKQMPKIIKGKVPNPGIKFIELLAWLIDFQPRTSISYYNSFDKRYDEETKEVIENTDVKIEEINSEVIGRNDSENQSHEDEEITTYEEVDKQADLVGEEKEPIVETTDRGVTEQTIEIEEETKEVDTEPKYVRLFSPHYIVLSCIILLFIGSTSFVAWEITPTALRMPKSGEECMYWDEDHYEPIDCKKTVNNATIIPLNLKTLKQQQKINLPDTLTSYSVGKVWYKGHGKGHEFFTAAGVYPPDTVRTLKKLSSGILKDHLSYYRYLLTRLIWFLCAAFFISLCGIWVSRLKKEVKKVHESKKVDNTEVQSSTESVQEINESGLVGTG
ncbi:hypothetical protein [Pedobacter sp. UBA5917]|jgi:hypothetical protein|uniref:hypothetical protein n=1 Tax=Pedobacter sp. UBA5917 TaxID=1947061 RepID=UPI0025FEDA32|nr:hypothetical protein [Pedobacter sp. UBA5917]